MPKIKRIYHTWDKWECFRAGFYENSVKGKNKKECELEYKNLLKDLVKFEQALSRVITEWRFSCEHYLTNENMNRIAWLGQASICIELGIPSCYRSGFFSLTKEEQRAANELALKWLNIWLMQNKYETVDLGGAGINSHADLY